jgi:hypothetical protein
MKGTTLTYLKPTVQQQKERYVKGKERKVVMLAA